MSTTIDYSRDPRWTDDDAEHAVLAVDAANQRGETPCVYCGRTVESGAMGRPCPATTSGYHDVPAEEGDR